MTILPSGAGLRGAAKATPLWREHFSRNAIAVNHYFPVRSTPRPLPNIMTRITECNDAFLFLCRALRNFISLRAGAIRIIGS
jgi:hypothetical protein